MLVQEIFSAFGFFFLIGISWLGNYLTQHISVEILNEDNENFHPNAFIASRAYKDLKVLNDFGPKATGSRANEVLTVNYLLERANRIKAEHENVSDISIDLQIVSGVHFVSAYYENIQNIVVKLHGKSDKSLMINCHFDSEYGSYGAGDDGINCCIMLEILRVLAKSDKQEYSIIFLFNGSEEGNLEGIQASHGFITQQKWAKDVKAFINLEAQGVGGRELLFRSGPKHSWLIKKYRESVKNPFGQVFAEEMFETNVLNSGTDFESFRDAGEVPGLDLSFCNKGWIYHTKFDHIRYITNDSIQNTGNNVLELTKKLANSKELENPPEGTAAVYFDMWGLFFVSYPAAVGTVINIVVSVLAVVLPFIIHTKFEVENVGKVARETLLSFATMVVSSILSLASCYAMGLIINAVDNSMFWFNATLLSLGVYSSLAVFVQIFVHHVLYSVVDNYTQKTFKSDKYEQRRKLHMRLNGVNLFWAIITVIFSCFGYRFVYVTMMMLLISLVTNLVMFFLHKVLPKTRLQSWILAHSFGHSFTVLWISYLFLLLWKIFIPISEKTYSSNPEMTISLLCGLMTVLGFSYFIPLSSLVKHRAVLYSALIGTFFVSLILAFSPAGFPYSGAIEDPRVQRHYLTHTHRTFYNSDNTVRYTDNGFYIKENERNSKRTLDSILEVEMKEATTKKDHVWCETEAFCGFPSYNSSNAFWLLATESPIVKKSSLKLTSRIVRGSVVEMSFDIEGSLLTILFVSQENGVEITETSKGFNKREWKEGKVAKYLKITYGKPSTKPFSLTMRMKTSTSEPVNDLLKITVVTIDSHFDVSLPTKEYQTLIDKFPDYVFVQQHQADVSSYAFN